MLEFKEGDIVKLKSGESDQEMTVEKPGAGMIFCSWMSGEQKKTGMFPPDALEKVESGG